MTDTIAARTLPDSALTDEVLASSRTILRRGRGTGQLIGLQQHFTPIEVAELAAAVHGPSVATLDLTAGNGALLAPVQGPVRFGIEIDPTHARRPSYGLLQGDVQEAAPLLALRGARWPRIVCNPPFGLDWRAPGGTTGSSTAVAWKLAQLLLASDGCGMFVAGRDRFAREIAGREDAAGVYALVDLEEDLFDGVALPIVLVWFVHPEAHAHPRDGGPLRLTAGRDQLAALASRLLAERQRVAPLVPADPLTLTSRLTDAFDLVSRQIADQRYRAQRRRAVEDISIKGASIRVDLSPIASRTLAERSKVRMVQRLDRQPLTYFGVASRDWKELLALAEDGVVTLQPGLVEKVQRAIADAELQLCPLYPLPPQMRLGWLQDLDQIRCIRSDPERGFRAGASYPISVSSDIRLTIHPRPVEAANGDIEVRRYEREALVLKVRVGSGTDAHDFTESPEDISRLIEHFEIPDPGDLGSRFPEQLAEARQLLRDLAEEHGFQYRTSPEEEDRDWQVEDLARLIVRGRGELCWEQGGGKSLGGLSLIHAMWERGARRQALIVTPQDLIPQWRAEARRFFHTDLIHITNPSEARAAAAHLAAGGEGLYVTHFEALSVVGRVDQPLPETPLKLPYDNPNRGAITSQHACPACHDTRGWRAHGRHACAACGHVHKRLKTRTAGAILAHAFRRGVIVVDEGTAAKNGSSLRSKAIRGLRARHSFLMTGTPVSNYVHDVFWLLWWARGDQDVSFPFDAGDGQALFEEQFCVREWYRNDDGHRVGRKVLPIVTNLSRLWRILASGMIRRRMERMGTLPSCTIKTVAAPMGAEQAALTRFWLSTANFESFFAYKHPGHKMLQAGLVERFAAMLGQLTKLEYAATLPEADPDRAWIQQTAGVQLTNWTPKNVKLLQIILDHVRRGEKVLFGSDLIETGRWFAEQFQAKGVNAAHLLDGDQTASPRRRARLIDAFQNGDTQVLCCGIQAVRQGHSLSAASVVVVNGLVFSYEQLSQFLARVRRLTSTRPITVYLGSALGTIDVTKIELTTTKNAAADLSLDGQLTDQPEEPISLDRVLRDLIRRGLKITGDEIPGTALQATWENEPPLLPARADTPSTPRQRRGPAPAHASRRQAPRTRR